MFEYNIVSAALIFAASKLNLPHRWAYMSLYLSNYFGIAYHSFLIYILSSTSDDLQLQVLLTGVCIPPPGSHAHLLNPGCCWLWDLWECLVMSWWVWFPAPLLPAFPYNASIRTWNQILIRISPACLSHTHTHTPTAAMSSGFGTQSVYNPVGAVNSAELDSFVPVGVQQV